MLDILQPDVLQVELLAYEIVARLQDTEPGHCARVDFLDRAEALSICRYIMQQQPGHEVVFHILASHEVETKNDIVFITTVLHCLPRQAFGQCFSEMRRVLKPSGRLLAIDFGLANEPKQLVRFPGGGHENLGDFGAIETARQFINTARLTAAMVCAIVGARELRRDLIA